jgi:hypothetical protein
MSTPSDGLSAGPSAVVPCINRTRAIRSPPVAIAPRNERLPSGTVPGKTFREKITLLSMSKNVMAALVGRSTSVKTAPNPSTVAGDCGWPGMVKVASTKLLPSAVKMRSWLKKLNVVS